MGKYNAGKVTVAVLFGGLVLALFLLVNSINLVSADNHNDDHNDQHNHSTPTSTPTPTPTPNRHDDNDCNNDHDNHDNHNSHDDHDDNCKNDHKSPTPTPTVTPTATPTATPVATVDPDVCHNIDGIQTGVPDGLHLGADNVSCVAFDPANPPQRTDEVAGTGTGGQVLGASTMAGTGSFDENLYMAIMALGGTLTAFGIKNFRKASSKAN